MSAPSTVVALESQLRGDVVAPGDPRFGRARKVYNAMIDKSPALFVRCEDVADVIKAVEYARARGSDVSILGGGHSGPGLGLVEGGVTIDLSNMQGVYVDPQRRTARAQGGCTLGQLDHATHAFGLATPAGIISTTGVGGLTLGGGHGYLTRKYGLTIDNLRSADVVLADGSFLTASDEENDDLFWALRGGGGNFGVVTSFELELHPVRTVYAGPMLWPVESADEVLRWYREFLPGAPEDLYGFFAFMVVPPAQPFPERLHGRRVCGCVWCYLGEPDDGEQALRPAREAAKPLWEHVGETPYPVLQCAFDGLYPPGLQWYWKGDFVREISDDAIAAHVHFGSQLPSALSTMHLYPIDGAASSISSSETAFSYRDARWSMVIVGVDAAPAHADRITAWARDYWNALHPHTLGGAYVNFMMEEGQDRVRSTYRDNYDRLVKVKAKYDPSNFFHINQNIVPKR